MKFILGSGELNGKMVDLGLLKTSVRDAFLISSTCGFSNPVGPYPNPFPTPAQQALLVNLK